MNVIDSFFVALGFKVDTSGLNELKAKTDEARESILSWGSALVGLVGGIALHKVAEIGSTFEQNRIQIAGFLSALGQSSDFNTGLQDASEVIQKITTDAAKLPGEAEEYIEVFKAGLPFVQAAMPGGSNNDILEFTDKLTAIGKTFGLDAGLIGREFDHMLSPGKGTASLRLPLFRQLLPFMQKVEGQAHLTAESFNAMAAPQRLHLLQSTFVKLQPMLDASADSFEAMWGSLKSGVQQLARMGTGGLFLGIKKQIQAFTSAFVDDKGKLTKRGQDIVAALSKISSVIGTLLRDGTQLTMWFIDVATHSKAFQVVLVALAGLLAGSIWESFAGKLAKFIKGFKLATLVSGLLWLALGLIVEDVWGFFHGADSLTGVLVNKLGPGIWVVAAAVGALATAFVALKVQALLAGAGMVLAFWPVFAAIAAVGLLGIAIYELWKHWDEIIANMRKGWEQFVAALKTGPHDIAVALGFGSTEDMAAAAAKQRSFGSGRGISAPGADVIWRNPDTGLEETHKAGWSPPAKYGSVAGYGGSTVNHGDVRIDKIEIKSTDPKEAGREVARQVRTAQSGMVR